MVKTQPAIHLSLGTLMRLAIRKHAQKSRSNSKQVVQKQDQSTNKIPKQVKNIHKPKLEQSVEQQEGLQIKEGKQCIWPQTSKE